MSFHTFNRGSYIDPLTITIFNNKVTIEPYYEINKRNKIKSSINTTFDNIFSKYVDIIYDNRIKKICLVDNNIDNTFALKISDIINNNKITHIDIEYNEICVKEGIKTIVTAIKNKPSITHIKFNENNINMYDRNFYSICNYRRNGLYKIIEVIENNPSITHFTFGKNNFDSEHLLNIITALVNSNSITHLTIKK